MVGAAVAYASIATGRARCAPRNLFSEQSLSFKTRISSVREDPSEAKTQQGFGPCMAERDTSYCSDFVRCLLAGSWLCGDGIRNAEIAM